MKLKKKSKALIIAAGIILLLSLFLYWQNNDIVTTNLNHSDSEIPQAFSGYKIAHISDLHNKVFGKNQKTLIRKIKNSAPDIIVITGDLIDKDRTDIEAAMDFVVPALKIAPIYYVSGNHEKASGKYDDLKIRLEKAGAIVLDDSAVSLEKNGESIGLAGLMDVGFYAFEYANEAEYRNVLKASLTDLLSSEDKFSVVLAHRPEFIKDYAACKADLVLSGHAHGGQIRLPFIGALAAPGQGIFPKYTAGSQGK